MTPKTRDFESALSKQLKNAESQKRKFIDVISRKLYQTVGGYPPAKGETHRMPACCNAMRNMKKPTDVVLYTTPSGQSTKLKIRYYLPRQLSD